MSPIKYCYEDVAYRKILYNPLKKTGFVPEKDSEIFVTAIPETATIEDLVKFFEQAGEIFQAKLMVKADGRRNRGFAFVTFMNKASAQMAMQELKDKPFIGGKNIFMQKSVDNCRIFVGGVPIRKSKDEIWQELKNCYNITNIVDVITYRNYSNPRFNRGFVFLEFRSHEEASYFRAKYSDKLRLFGKRLLVDWSVPIMETDENTLSKVKILYLRNLDVTQTSEEFGKIIYELMDRNHVEKVHKFKDYAFVHLSTREEAERLMQKLIDYFQGTVVEITFSKPPNKFTDREFRDKALVARRITKNNNTHRVTPSASSWSSATPSSSRTTPSSTPSLASPQSAGQLEGDLEAQLSNITLQCVEVENRLRDLQSHKRLLQSRLSSSGGQSPFPNVAYCHSNFSVAPDFPVFWQQYREPENTMDLERMVNNLVNDA